MLISKTYHVPPSVLFIALLIAALFSTPTARHHVPGIRLAKNKIKQKKTLIRTDTTDKTLACFGPKRLVTISRIKYTSHDTIIPASRARKVTLSARLLPARTFMINSVIATNAKSIAGTSFKTLPNNKFMPIKGKLGPFFNFNDRLPHSCIAKFKRCVEVKR